MPACKVCGRWFAKIRDDEELCDKCGVALSRLSGYAVPVVRCKDCKHSTLPSELTQRYGVPGTLTCHNRRSPCNRRNVGGDDFCSYGERKDVDNAEG